jgi:tripartite-type tricarboxylate transporter receptor subunit TctC
VLGTRFKIVTGYKSSAAVDIALERGEVQARSGSYESAYTQHPAWIKEKKVVFLVQVGARREKTLPDVPLLTELARNDREREVLKLVSAPILLGRPYLAPPGVSAPRAAQLRKGFADTMADAVFLAETRKLGLDIAAMTGEEVAKVVDDTINAAPEVVAQAKKVMPKRKAKKKKKKAE